MANTYLTKTFASDSNRKTWTWSAWIKRSGLGGTQTLMTQVDAWNGNGNAGFYIVGDQLTSYNFTSSLNSGTDSYNRPSRYLRDVNSWYHIVVRLDTTQSTASNRCRWYVNGEQLTNFVYANYPSLNQDCNFNGGDPHGIGSHTAGENYFDGSMTHVYFTDGYSYDPSAFGETDATTGEWKAKTSPSVNYGTHGFLILRDGNTITDQSSNSNDFTLAGGTLTDLKDNPENVFATLNPLSTNSAVTLSKGNSEFNYTGGDAATFSTLAASSGKYYWEIKALGADDGGVQKWTPGVIGAENHMFYNNRDGGYAPKAYAWYLGNGNIYNNNSSLSSSYGTANQNDIIGVALDMDNLKLYFSKNGTFLNSADPTSGATGTGAISLSANYSPYIPHAGEGSGGAINFVFNFGNGYFGTTAITTNSGNGYAGAEGASKFNYTVPTGYSALSTKGLNE